MADLLVLTFIVLLAITVAKFAQNTDKLPRNNRKELIAARNLIDELAVSASEHATLGDNYASIVLDEIRKYRREVQ